MSLRIRPAIPADVPTVLRFIRELAEYEREPSAVVATDELIRTALFDEGHVAHCLIASLDGTPVGFALYFFNFSTWLGRAGLYLEDLYVTPSARRKGVGRAFLAELARIAIARNCGRMEWPVLDWNEQAIAFYRALGACPLSEWTVYRLTGDTLQAAARLAPPT
jgi:GNAT superfamily N-acetyltransferase